jgi:riboflavin kinase/FMN adenylyltransferase
MQIINDYTKRPDEAKKIVIALGNFDGVHKGHIEVINTAIKIAKTNNLSSAVMTFQPHPIELFKPEIKNYRLTSIEQKAKLFENLGVDYLYIINFNIDFASITAEDFIKNILLEKLDASHIVTGYDYVFGNKKAGNTQMLQQLSPILGYGFTCVEAVGANETFSSTKIRNALKEADLAKAHAILGRNYEVAGKVVRGDNRGKSIGFPTINVDSGDALRPKSGVYAVKITIHQEIPSSPEFSKKILGRSDEITLEFEKSNSGNDDMVSYNGVANIGTKPTFAGIDETLEVHIFDFAQDVYGKNVEIEFLRYIRPERKFANAEELVKQIQKDCAMAKQGS